MDEQLKPPYHALGHRRLAGRENSRHAGANALRDTSAQRKVAGLRSGGGDESVDHRRRVPSNVIINAVGKGPQKEVFIMESPPRLRVALPSPARSAGKTSRGVIDGPSNAGAGGPAPMPSELSKPIEMDGTPKEMQNFEPSIPFNVAERISRAHKISYVSPQRNSPRLKNAKEGAGRRGLSRNPSDRRPKLPRRRLPLFGPARGPSSYPGYTTCSQTSDFPAGAHASARRFEIVALASSESQRVTHLHFSGFKTNPPAMRATRNGSASAATKLAEAIANPTSSAHDMEVAPRAR